MNESAKREYLGSRAVSVPLTVIALIAGVWALRTAYVVFLPLACSLYLAVLVRPLQDKIRRRLPRRLRWLSLLLTFLVGVGVAALLVGLIWIALALLQRKAPPYIDAIKAHWQTLVAWTGDQGLPLQENLDRFTGMIERLLGFVTSTVVSLWSVIALIVLVFFLTILLLLEWNEWRQKARQAASGSRSTRILDAIDNISKKIRSFLVVRTVLSLISGLATGLWLWAAGVELAFVWGLLTFILNYIPSLGSIISVVAPTIFALVQLGLWRAVIALAGMIVIEQIVAGLIEPRMQGRAVRLSPFIVLMSLVFWGWVWGIVGMLLAVPLTVTFVVICSEIDSLEWLAEIMGRSGGEKV